MVFSFEKSEEYLLREILRGIQNKTKDNKIRNCILDNEILFRGDLVINPICRILERNNEDIHLTAYEFDTLFLLAKRPGWVYSRETIYNLIWNEPYNFSELSVIHTIG